MRAARWDCDSLPQSCEEMVGHKEAQGSAAAAKVGQALAAKKRKRRKKSRRGFETDPDPGER